MYTAPLQDIIHSYGVSTMVYADDTQLYLSFKPRDRDNAVKTMEKCIESVKSWAVHNKLVLNDKKTELVHFTSKFIKDSVPSPSIVIGDSVIKASMSVRNLGLKMDSNLCMGDQVSKVCNSSMAALRSIAKIREYLDKDNTIKHVHAFVTSRLDLYNSLLFGIPDSNYYEAPTNPEHSCSTCSPHTSS